MPTPLAPYQIIERMVALRQDRTDLELLAELQQLPPLSDERDAAWDDPSYWETVAYRFIALTDLVALRRLRAAVPLVLDRMCLGDPGEIMRGIRHSLEAAVAEDLGLLADFCLAASQSPRPGTILWAIDELIVLDDPRAEPVFQAALTSAVEDIRSRAAIGLQRLADGAA